MRSFAVLLGLAPWAQAAVEVGQVRVLTALDSDTTNDIEIHVPVTIASFKKKYCTGGPLAIYDAVKSVAPAILQSDIVKKLDTGLQADANLNFVDVANTWDAVACVQATTGDTALATQTFKWKYDASKSVTKTATLVSQLTSAATLDTTDVTGVQAKIQAALRISLGTLTSLGALGSNGLAIKTLSETVTRQANVEIEFAHAKDNKLLFAADVGVTMKVTALDVRAINNCAAHRLLIHAMANHLFKQLEAVQLAGVNGVTAKVKSATDSSRQFTWSLPTGTDNEKIKIEANNFNNGPTVVTDSICNTSTANTSAAFKVTYVLHVDLAAGTYDDATKKNTALTKFVSTDIGTFTTATLRPHVATAIKLAQLGNGETDATYKGIFDAWAGQKFDNGGSTGPVNEWGNALALAGTADAGTSFLKTIVKHVSGTNTVTNGVMSFSVKVGFALAVIGAQNTDLTQMAQIMVYTIGYFVETLKTEMLKNNKLTHAAVAPMVWNNIIAYGTLAGTVLKSDSSTLTVTSGAANPSAGACDKCDGFTVPLAVTLSSEKAAANTANTLRTDIDIALTSTISAWATIQGLVLQELTNQSGTKWNTHAGFFNGGVAKNVGTAASNLSAHVGSAGAGLRVALKGAVMDGYAAGKPLATGSFAISKKRHYAFSLTFDTVEAPDLYPVWATMTSCDHYITLLNILAQGAVNSGVLMKQSSYIAPTVQVTTVDMAGVTPKNGVNQCGKTAAISGFRNPSFAWVPATTRTATGATTQGKGTFTLEAELLIDNADATNYATIATVDIFLPHVKTQAQAWGKSHYNLLRGTTSIGYLTANADAAAAALYPQGTIAVALSDKTGRAGADTLKGTITLTAKGANIATGWASCPAFYADLNDLINYYTTKFTTDVAKVTVTTVTAAPTILDATIGGCSGAAFSSGSYAAGVGANISGVAAGMKIAMSYSGTVVGASEYTASGIDAAIVAQTAFTDASPKLEAQQKTNPNWDFHSAFGASLTYTGAASYSPAPNWHKQPVGSVIVSIKVPKASIVKKGEVLLAGDLMNKGIGKAVTDKAVDLSTNTVLGSAAADFSCADPVITSAASGTPPTYTGAVVAPGVVSGLTEAATKKNADETYNVVYTYACSVNTKVYELAALYTDPGKYAVAGNDKAAYEVDLLRFTTAMALDTTVTAIRTAAATLATGATASTSIYIDDTGGVTVATAKAMAFQVYKPQITAKFTVKGKAPPQVAAASADCVLFANDVRIAAENAVGAVVNTAITSAVGTCVSHTKAAVWTMAGCVAVFKAATKAFAASRRQLSDDAAPQRVLSTAIAYTMDTTVVNTLPPKMSQTEVTAKVTAVSTALGLAAFATSFDTKLDEAVKANKIGETSNYSAPEIAAAVYTTDAYKATVSGLTTVAGDTIPSGTASSAFATGLSAVVAGLASLLLFA